MSIIYQEKEKSFILQSKNSTYVMKVTKNKYIEHVYYGGKIEQPVVSALCKSSFRCSFCANPEEDAE
jgi:alpha-galactosidase